MATISSSSPVLTRAASRAEVSLFRLYLLRAAYLLLVVGLGLMVWPSMIHHPPWTLWQGVGKSILTAVSLLAVLGLRYPLKMLPLLFFELIWKSIWLITVPLPLWLNHNQIDADTASTVQACLWGVIFPIVIPWRYVFANFARQPGDRWK
jgi:hypothetical protein